MFPDGNSQRVRDGLAVFSDVHTKPDARSRFWRRLVPGVLLLVLLAGCGQEATPAPTAVVPPTAMPTSDSTSTPPTTASIVTPSAPVPTIAQTPDVPVVTILRTLERHDGLVKSVAFSPDGQTLASGSWDNKVKLWKVSDGSLLHTLEGHTDNIESVAFSPDGRLLASASDDETVKLWRVK